MLFSDTSKFFFLLFFFPESYDISIGFESSALSPGAASGPSGCRPGRPPIARRAGGGSNRDLDELFLLLVDVENQLLVSFVSFYWNLFEHQDSLTVGNMIFNWSKLHNQLSLGFL